ncbi:MAG: serine/threonine-protein kinase [Bacteroidota bacterium]
MNRLTRMLGGLLHGAPPPPSRFGLSTTRLPGGVVVRIKADHPGAVYKKGDVIGTSYQVLGVLGLGGFSVVYLVYSRETRAVSALKTLRDEYLEDRETRDQFRKEAKVWVELERHPYVVRAHFIEELAGRLYIGMEYIEPNEEGLNSLEGYLARRPPDLNQTLRWSVQFCHGMEHAHARGIRCHRDVKPANIMIDKDKVVKITDFGFAEVIDMSRARAAMDPVQRRRRMLPEFSGFGTPTYMPPEQFQNASRCDERSDIYSFGVVLYQMASRGRLPYETTFRLPDMKKDPATVWREMHRLHTEAGVVPLTSPVFPFIQRCLQKEPSARYQSFYALRADLETLLKRMTGETIDAHKSRSLEAWELYNKAYSLSSLGHLEEAVAHYTKVLELELENSDAWNNKGVCLRKLGKLEEALACYDAATEADKHNASAWSNRGNCLYTLGRFQEALAALIRAIDVDPRNESAWLNKGLVEERLGRSADAAASYRTFLELPPVQYAAHVPFAQKRVAELVRA